MWPVFLLQLTTSLTAQKIDSALTVFRNKFPAEKVYFHYNKQYYTAGETIWFKAYLVFNHAPSSLSNNLYLQFSDDKGKIISNKKFPVIGATVSGNIDIPDSVAAGIYSIKAFTPAMLSPDAAFIYTKEIHIYNKLPGKEDQPLPESGTPKYAVQFFPEGGNLVADIQTVIAFKATDEYGYPVVVKGIIQSEDSIMIIPFSSFHDGIGRFQLTPQGGRQYIAITEINGQQGRFFLPPVQSTGLALKVEDETGGKAFTILRNNNEKLITGTFKLVVQMSNIVIYEKEFYFGDNLTAGGLINTVSLPSGILHFTVFNHDNAPLLERLSFVNNREYEAGANISVLNLGTRPRGFNSFQFNFPDTVQRSCSVSVTDYLAEPAGRKENIVSSLLLTSDLRGKIVNPMYYFSGVNDSVRIALDNLMLTHGWRKFNWKKVLNNEYAEKKPEDKYLINISGTVKSQNLKEVMTGGFLNIFISTEDSSVLAYKYPVDNNGHFLLDSLFFSGLARVNLSYTNLKGKQIPVTILPDAMKSFDWPAYVVNEVKITDNYSLPEQPVSKENKETSDLHKEPLIQHNDTLAKDLENVNVISKGKRAVDILNEKYTNGIFRTGSRYIIDNITKPEVLAGGGPGAVRDFIASQLPRVNVKNGQFVNIVLFNAPVAVFIDEFPANMFQLDQLRIEQIGIVKFWDNDPVVVSSDMGGGTIVVYTKKIEDVKAYSVHPLAGSAEIKKPMEWPVEASGENQLNGNVNNHIPAFIRNTSDTQVVTMTQKGFENAKELQNVNVTAKLKRAEDALNEKYTSDLFRTGGKVVADNVNNKVVNGTLNGFDFIKNRISNIDTQFNKFVNRRNFSLQQENGAMAYKYWEVGIFINELPADLLQLKLIRADQIALVKFFQAGFIGSGSEYPGGAVAIYLKKGEDIAVERPNATYFTYNGYSIEKEFYNPDYSITSEQHTNQDLRTTLYWNPKLYTSANENCIRVNFFNNDLSKKFKIVLEGIDTRGKLIFLEKTIEEGQKP